MLKHAGLLGLILLGVPAGVGAFTFVYAKGFSYLSSDPRACVNCHVMKPQYDAWLTSGHRHTATCLGCHLPHAGVAKAARALHRKAQWRLDFVAAENSMGFHAPQELARILGEAIDLARQGQLAAERAARAK